MVWSFILLMVFVIILHWCTLIYIDDLKSRIDRRVDEDKWQNEYINQLCSRASKLEAMLEKELKLREADLEFRMQTSDWARKRDQANQELITKK